MTAKDLFYSDEPDAPVAEADMHWPRAKGDPCIAAVDVTREELVSRFGAPTAEGDDILPGLGFIENWCRRWPCGCEITFSWRHWNRAPSQGAEIYTNDADVAHALHHVRSVVDVPLRWCVAPEENPHHLDPATLTRQGDDGHRVDVRTFDSRFAAQCALRAFEARGHKQLYAVRLG